MGVGGGQCGAGGGGAASTAFSTSRLIILYFAENEDIYMPVSVPGYEYRHK